MNLEYFVFLKMLNIIYVNISLYNLFLIMIVFNNQLAIFLKM